MFCLSLWDISSLNLELQFDLEWLVNECPSSNLFWWYNHEIEIMALVAFVYNFDQDSKLYRATALLFIPPRNKSFQEYIGNIFSVRPSIHVFIYLSVCIQNTSFCQSAGGCNKSHLVIALVFPCTLLTKVTSGVHYTATLHYEWNFSAHYQTTNFRLFQTLYCYSSE